jgi:hypothetical protein
MCLMPFLYLLAVAVAWFSKSLVAIVASRIDLRAFNSYVLSIVFF